MFLSTLSTCSRRRVIAAATSATAAAATAAATPRTATSSSRHHHHHVIITSSSAAAIATPTAAVNTGVPLPFLQMEVPSTEVLNGHDGCLSRWAVLQPEAAARASLSPGCYRITIADADVVRCVRRTEPHKDALMRAYDTHALVYWPSATACSVEEGHTPYEYGVVFVPGTGAGAGPAYRHRAARNKYPGPIDVATFHPDHEAFFPSTARALVAKGVPSIQVTWSDFRTPPASAAEHAYGYDGGSKTNPAITVCTSTEGDQKVETFVDAMGDVASAKVEAAVKLLLLNGCRSVVLVGHSMGAAICCETARRLLAAETRAAGLKASDASQKAETGGAHAVSWRRPSQLRALCMLSGAAIHWTLGSCFAGWLACAEVQSLLEQHQVPLLIVNAEHDIGCAKGVYWEEGDGRVEQQGMFARTARDYYIIKDHTHSWFQGKESSKPSNVADETTWTHAERLEVDGDGRKIYDVSSTIRTLGSLLREWIARHDRAAWSARHRLDTQKSTGEKQTAIGKWISVGSRERSARHSVLLARL